MRVLLVKDDLQCGQHLFRELRNAGYNVDWVRDARAGSLAIGAAYYAVVLLDLSLMCGGALELLRRSRESGNKVPVLTFITSGDPQARVHSLDIGADDCMPKPFDVREVLARIRAVLRRQAGSATSRIGNKQVSLDLDHRTLRCNGVSSSLSAREFALMHALLERPEAILSRAQLEERIYGWGREIESNALDVLIHSMRKRFGRNLIENVRGIGWTARRAVGGSAHAHCAPIPSTMRSFSSFEAGLVH
ncbi:two component transcriptional regulator [Caballeronia temeraria]|uniref:Two component transcriptional regulator n=1 Tax=Caballeronia temeraria TaxID=1777137 RepID=A0A158DC70_9BURK|nr:response regulator transcription factor [Caballeronia temeraria]SAK92244.1 two component transcriptional regulator [Caballeronia temeraria]